MKNRANPFLCALALLAGLSGTRAFASAADSLRFTTTERVIGKADEVAEVPDQSHVHGPLPIYIAKRSGFRFLMRAGVEGRPYEDIKKGTFVLSSDGSRVVYVAQRTKREPKKLKQEFVVCDSVEGPECDAIETPPVFSPGDRHLVYTARRYQRQFVVIDSTPGEEWDRVYPPVFSKDGEHVAYNAGRNRKWCVVLDGVAMAEYDNLTLQVVFSDDGRHLAHGASRSGKWFVVLDGVEGPPYDGLVEGSLKLSADGVHLAYVAIRGHKQLVVRDRNEGAEYDAVAGMDFSPDGRRYAYRASRGHKAMVVTDGVEGPPYDEIEGGPCVSPDGRHVAYSARQGRKAFVNVDGERGAEYDGVGWLLFTSEESGGHFLYYALRGEKMYWVVDGVEGPEFDPPETLGSIALSLSFLPRFIPNGRGLAYIVRHGSAYHLMVNGVEGPAYDWISGLDLEFHDQGRYASYPVIRRGKGLVVVAGVEGREYDSVGSPEFSADEQHVAYQAKRGKEAFVVLDGTEVGPYDRFPEEFGLQFEGSTSVHTVAVRGEDLMSVDIRWPDEQPR